MNLDFRLFLLIYISCFNSYACNLDPKYEYWMLSAPVSVVIKELGLISEVKKIGSFHPFKEIISKVDGGIFLRAKNLNLSQKSLIIYDESKALNREFLNLNVKLEKIITRNLSAIVATQYILDKLAPYLIKCNSKVSSIKNFLKETKLKIKDHKFLKTYLFYLGAISSGARNNLIIANDGFVLDLKNNQSFTTYPSSLAYVSWSSKELKKLKNYISIGVESNENKDLKEIDKKSINLFYPGILVPGLQQVKFLDYLIDKIKAQDQ